MELPVYTIDGGETGRSVTLDGSIFGVEPNDHVLWLDVRRVQAHARQGTHKVKERGENAHSTRKLYRQKGTGLSRAGSARSPIRKTGARTFGPRPRTYRLKLSKKTRALARRSALSYKAQGEAVYVVDDLSLETPSTKHVVALLDSLGLTGKKALLLTAAHEEALYRSSRNLAKVRVKEARNASTVDLLDAQVLVVQESALDVLSDILGAPEPAVAE